LKAVVIDEYVDRGESARSADRPELQRLLNDLTERKKQIDYIIVHKVDRLARSLHDDVMIGLAIQNAGATLVSVTENIDETPSGRLLHGIMATIAEFYSRNLAAEALKGATEKAKRGGTPYRAPLGYINVIKHIDGREARMVEPDPERAPHITWAFKQYATGNHTVKTIGRGLNERGFRSRRTGQSMSKPLSNSAVANMLSNRYYAGYVKYRGVMYRGRHKPIVTAAVFANVQAIRDSRNFGNRRRKYFHYLIGTVFCGQCGRRMSYTVAKHKYGYIYCMSRQRGFVCSQPYIPLKLVEQLIASQFQNAGLTAADRTALQKEVRSQLRYEIEGGKTEISIQEKRLTRLLMERQRLLQAYYDEEIGKDLLGDEQRRINKEIAQLKDIIGDTKAARKAARRNYEAALEFADTLNLESAYMNAHPLLRRALNRALFAEIRIDDTNSYVISNRQGRRKKHDVRIVETKLQPKIDYQQLVQAVIGLTLQRSDLEEG